MHRLYRPQGFGPLDWFQIAVKHRPLQCLQKYYGSHCHGRPCKIISVIINLWKNVVKNFPSKPVGSRRTVIGVGLAEGHFVEQTRWQESPSNCTRHSVLKIRFDSCETRLYIYLPSSRIADQCPKYSPMSLWRDKEGEGEQYFERASEISQECEWSWTEGSDLLLYMFPR